MTPQQHDTYESKQIRRNRIVNRATWVLVIVWAAILFAGDGPGRRFLAGAFKNARAAYLTRFGWSSIRSGSSIINGSSDSAQIVVFMDYHCPYCRQSEAVLDSLQSIYPDITIGYRYTFPSQASTSRLAALGAVCALRFDALQQLHAHFYTLASADSDSTFYIRLPTQARAVLRTDMAATIQECIEDPPHDVVSRLHTDSVLSSQLQIRRTPTLIGREGVHVGLPTLHELIRIAGLSAEQT